MVQIRFSWNGIKTIVRKFYPEAKGFKKLDPATVLFKVNKKHFKMKMSKEGFFFYDQFNRLVKEDRIPENYDPRSEEGEQL